MSTLASPTQIGGVELLPGATRPRIAANSLFVESAGLLIDTGADEATLRRLLADGTVRSVLYTHYHSDHRWWGSLFAALPTWAHRLDAPALENEAEMVATVGGPERLAAGFGAWFEANGVVGLRVDHYIEDETPLVFDDCTLVPLHMPGHTPGMLCPLFPRERLLFLTDFDLTPFGPWYGNVGSDLDAFEASLARVETLDFDWVMTSHLPTALRREEALKLLREFRSHFARREQALVDALAEPMPLRELSSIGICYESRHINNNPALHWFERVQVEHHLRRLEKRGFVEKVEDGRWRRR